MKMGRNFYTSVNPIIIFLGCLGLVPYYFKNNRLCSSHFNSAYIAILIVIYSILCYDAINMKHPILQQTSMTSEMIYRIVSIKFIMVTLINGIIGRKKFIQFSRTMLRCENAFKGIVHAQRKTIHRKMYMYATVFTIVIAINVGTHICYMTRAYDDKISIYITIFGLPMLVNINVCLLALLHILEIRHGFCVLNGCLERMQVTKSWKPFKYETLLKQKSWKPNVENLAKIGMLHLELNNCIREFNDIFGVLLLGKFVICFVSTLTGVYFAYVNYQESTYIISVGSTMIAFSYTVSLTILCHQCNSTVKEVNACLYA